MRSQETAPEILANNFKPFLWFAKEILYIDHGQKFLEKLIGYFQVSTTPF